MRTDIITLALCISFIAGCSSAPILMKCPNKLADPSILHCEKEHRKGYWDCDKPADMRVCEEPQ